MDLLFRCLQGLGFAVACRQMQNFRHFHDGYAQERVLAAHCSRGFLQRFLPQSRGRPGLLAGTCSRAEPHDS